MGQATPEEKQKQLELATIQGELERGEAKLAGDMRAGKLKLQQKGILDQIALKHKTRIAQLGNSIKNEQAEKDARAKASAQGADLKRLAPDLQTQSSAGKAATVDLGLSAGLNVGAGGGPQDVQRAKSTQRAPTVDPGTGGGQALPGQIATTTQSFFTPNRGGGFLGLGPGKRRQTGQHTNIVEDTARKNIETDRLRVALRSRDGATLNRALQGLKETFGENEQFFQGVIASATQQVQRADQERREAIPEAVRSFMGEHPDADLETSTAAVTAMSLGDNEGWQQATQDLGPSMTAQLQQAELEKQDALSKQATAGMKLKEQELTLALATQASDIQQAKADVEKTKALAFQAESKGEEAVEHAEKFRVDTAKIQRAEAAAQRLLEVEVANASQAPFSQWVGDGPGYGSDTTAWERFQAHGKAPDQNEATLAASVYDELGVKQGMELVHASRVASVFDNYAGLFMVPAERRTEGFSIEDFVGGVFGGATERLAPMTMGLDQLSQMYKLTSPDNPDRAGANRMIKQLSEWGLVVEKTRAEMEASSTLMTTEELKKTKFKDDGKAVFFIHEFDPGHINKELSHLMLRWEDKQFAAPMISAGVGKIAERQGEMNAPQEPKPTEQQAQNAPFAGARAAQATRQQAIAGQLGQ